MALDHVVRVMCESERRYTASPAFEKDIRHPLEIRSVYDSDGTIDEVHEFSSRPWRKQLEVGQRCRVALERSHQLGPLTRVSHGHGDHPESCFGKTSGELNEREGPLVPDETPNPKERLWLTIALRGRFSNAVDQHWGPVEAFLAQAKLLRSLNDDLIGHADSQPEEEMVAAFGWQTAEVEV